MIKHNQDGAVSGLAVSLILTTVLLIAVIVFGVWAFSSRQDYKDNSDAKAAAAVKTAVTQESAAKDKQFAEDAKKPLTAYNGPSNLGSIILKYPKTWSVYNNASSNNGSALDLYFNPVMVPTVGSQDSVFALHVQVLNQPYADVANNFQGQQQEGVLTVSAYALPKQPKVIGIKAVGAISNNTNGTIIILPVRSQTIEIETDGTQYLNDFNNNILPNFNFSP